MLINFKFLNSLTLLIVIAGIILSAAHASAAANVSINLQLALSGTYYVKSQVTDSIDINLLVDTGSSYTILDQLTIDELLTLGIADYKYDITGVMADGSEKHVQVYMVKELLVGECLISNVEVVAFEPKATFVLGINALKQLSPFSIDISKNALIANCNKQASF